MSPVSTLKSCGNSSMRSLRITRPTRVTRLSLAAAQRGVPSFSASARMLLNFTTWKRRPCSPTRCCRYKIGPLRSSITTTAVTTMTGEASTIRPVAQTMSKARLTMVRKNPWLNPSPKTSQPADTESSRICPSVCSKCVAMSTTRMPLSLQSSSSRNGMLPPRRSASATTISSTRCCSTTSVSEAREATPPQDADWSTASLGLA